MPEVFGQMMQQPQAASPTPFTPDMQKAYDSWRQQKIQQWVNTISAAHQGDSSEAQQPTKLRGVYELYSKDSPFLRQEFLKEYQRPGGVR